MREETIINGFKSLEQRVQQVIAFIQNFQNAIRLDSTGKEIRLLAIQRLLLKKGLITEVEMTEESGNIIKEMQKQAEEEVAKQAEEAAKPKLIVPTTEQTAQVAATTVDVQIPPQV